MLHTHTALIENFSQFVFRHLCMKYMPSRKALAQKVKGGAAGVLSTIPYATFYNLLPAPFFNRSYGIFPRKIKTLQSILQLTVGINALCHFPMVVQKVQACSKQLFSGIHELLPKRGKEVLNAMSEIKNQFLHDMVFLPTSMIIPTIYKRMESGVVIQEFANPLAHRIKDVCKKTLQKISTVFSARNFQNKLAYTLLQYLRKVSKLNKAFRHKFNSSPQDGKNELFEQLCYYAQKKALPLKEFNEAIILLQNQKKNLSGIVDLQAKLFAPLFREITIPRSEEQCELIKKRLQKLNPPKEWLVAYKLKYTCKVLLKKEDLTDAEVEMLKSRLCLCKLVLPPKDELFILENFTLETFFSPQKLLQKSLEIYLKDHFFYIIKDKFLHRDEALEFVTPILRKVFVLIIRNYFKIYSNPHHLAFVLAPILGTSEKDLKFSLGERRQKQLQEAGRKLLESLESEELCAKLKDLQIGELLEGEGQEIKDKARNHLKGAFTEIFNKMLGTEISEEIQEVSTESFSMKIKKIPIIGALYILFEKIIFMLCFSFRRDQSITFSQYVFGSELREMSKIFIEKAMKITGRDDLYLQYLLCLEELANVIKNEDQIKEFSLGDRKTFGELEPILEELFAPSSKSWKVWTCTIKPFSLLAPFRRKFQPIFEAAIKKVNSLKILEAANRKVKEVSLTTRIINEFKFGGYLEDFSDTEEQKIAIELFVNEHLMNHLRRVWQISPYSKNYLKIKERYVAQLLASPSPLTIIQENELTDPQVLRERLLRGQIQQLLTEVEIYTEYLGYFFNPNHPRGQFKVQPLQIQNCKEIIVELQILQGPCTGEQPHSYLPTDTKIVIQQTNDLLQRLQHLHQQWQASVEEQAPCIKRKATAAIEIFQKKTFGKKNYPDSLSYTEKCDLAIESLEDYLKQLREYPEEITAPATLSYFQTIHHFELKTIGRLPPTFSIQQYGNEIENIQENIAHLKHKREEAEQEAQEILSFAKQQLQNFEQEVHIDKFMQSSLILKTSQEIKDEIPILKKHLKTLKKQQDYFSSRLQKFQEDHIGILLQKNKNDFTKLSRKIEKHRQYLEMIESSSKGTLKFTTARLSRRLRTYGHIKPLGETEQELFKKIQLKLKEASLFEKMIMPHFQGQIPEKAQVKDHIIEFYSTRISERKDIQFKIPENELDSLPKVNYEGKRQKIKQFSGVIKDLDISLKKLEKYNEKKQCLLRERKHRSKVNKQILREIHIFRNLQANFEQLPPNPLSTLENFNLVEEINKNRRYLGDIRVWKNLQILKLPLQEKPPIPPHIEERMTALPPPEPKKPQERPQEPFSLIDILFPITFWEYMLAGLNTPPGAVHIQRGGALEVVKSKKEQREMRNQILKKTVPKHQLRAQRKKFKNGR